MSYGVTTTPNKPLQAHVLKCNKFTLHCAATTHLTVVSVCGMVLQARAFKNACCNVTSVFVGALQVYMLQHYKYYSVHIYKYTLHSVIGAHVTSLQACIHCTNYILTSTHVTSKHVIAPQLHT